MDVGSRVAQLIEPSLEALGYDVVRIRLSGAEPQTLQVMAERKDRREMNVDDCAYISRNISAILDVEDPIASAYDLEVSSPGIDRPLVRKDDFARFAGQVARVETQRTIDGQKRFKGRLSGLDGDNVVIDCDGVESSIPFDEIVQAKLLLTDELIAQTMSRQNG